jgi:hypothetical protein
MRANQVYGHRGACGVSPQEIVSKVKKIGKKKKIEIDVKVV